MTELIDVIDLAQAGGIAILLVAVFHLWNRLNALTDRFLTYLDRKSRDGDPIAQRTLDDDR